MRQYPAVDIAEDILDRLSGRGETSCTPWKLQKLLYYSQAWSLVWDGAPLFNEQIEAWADGPVVPAVYALHRRTYNLRPGDLKRNPQAIDDADVAGTLDEVLRHYGGMSGRELRDKTHAEYPWRIARGNRQEGSRGNEEITHESMIDFFGGQ